MAQDGTTTKRQMEEELRALQVRCKAAEDSLRRIRKAPEGVPSESEMSDGASREQSEKLESLLSLAEGIAHDFNNHLMVILGNAEFALMDLNSSSPAHNCVVAIQKEARRAADLSEYLLSYSGKEKLVFEPLDLSALIGKMGHLLKIATAHKAQLVYNLSSDIMAVEGDTTKVRQIIMALVGDLASTMREKRGIITLTTGMMECGQVHLYHKYFDEKLPGGRYVFVEVSDTSQGEKARRPRRHQEPLFTTEVLGRGPGLASALGIVHAHGGALTVYGKPHAGLTFRILFPAVQAAAEPPAAPTEEISDRQEWEGLWRGKGTVLLVDDEENVRLIASRMLESLGFDVLMASDGAEAVSLFRAKKDNIDFVLLDITMPGMGGEEASREILSIRPDAKVLLTSGYKQDHLDSDFTQKGLAGFIHKPYELRVLSEKLREVLAPSK